MHHSFGYLLKSHIPHFCWGFGYTTQVRNDQLDVKQLDMQKSQIPFLCVGGRKGYTTPLVLSAFYLSSL